MKLLILLSLLVSSTTYADLDAELNSSSNSDKISYYWGQFFEDELDPLLFNMAVKSVASARLSKLDRIKLKIMRSSFLISNNSEDLSNKIIDVDSIKNDEAFQYISILSMKNPPAFKFSEQAARAIKKAKLYLSKVSRASKMTTSDIKDVVFKTPDFAHYENGKYKNTVTLFLFCRESREFPCLFIAKDMFGNFVRKSSGHLWSKPALAKSARNRPYNITNGETPTGIHRMDSVMLQTNRPAAFGKFRRVILDWIPRSDSTKINEQHFLPRSQWSKNWWKRASISRDAGRKHLRIHGTGRVNDEPKLSYYPHVPTSGCISTLEGTYNGTIFKDQRNILDTLMDALRLKPIYENEIEISGVLFVMNINNKNSKVTLTDLRRMGIR